MIIKHLFEQTEKIIEKETKGNKSEDLLRQYEIVRSRKWDKITTEPDVLNNLVVQAASYSVVRKFFKVLYPEDIYKFDLHYSSNFFSSDSIPRYSYEGWDNIVISWGNTLLKEEALPEQSTAGDLISTLKKAKWENWGSYTKKPRSRIVLSFATALPKVKSEILGDPLAFFTRLDEISKRHPGKAFDLATKFSEGIIQMGNPLVCNFFKELGLLYYVKVDVHVGDFIDNVSFCKKFNKKEQFILSWLLAREAGMEPFFLDKILYVGGKYAKSRIMNLFNEHRHQYIESVNNLVGQIPVFL